MSQTTTIRRGFVDLPHGQMHYRMAGEAGDPLLILHASPGSSRQQVRLIETFAGEARVFAPDTPGNGDSTALSAEEPTIPDLAAAALAFMDQVGLESANVYGSHTGAAIASELAIMAPGRVRHLVLDGVSLLTAEELEDILANYAFPFVPDLEGAYLARIFQFCRDQYMFFPWYRRTRAARRDGGMGSAEDLHAWITEVMKASQTYHLNYRAAFKWDVEGRLPLVTCKTLVIAAENDPLFDATKAVAPLAPNGRFVELPRMDAPDFLSVRHDVMADFFVGKA
jgi:pimeloyl-ACP methyl ester carboxylesterase